ncbi:MAG: glycosyltransferase family 2 protein, partial [Archaeoglobi archaeon]|nr:glycosyltransferase family 2 protein [Candidatus Mnemosynella bozhongmuii]
MKVSVIISTYTQERFEDVLKCLEHIKKQTRKPDEVILVLDPKEDLYEFYYERLGDENIMIISADDSGLSNARNAGVKASSGEIIVFIDDDAYPDPH